MEFETTKSGEKTIVTMLETRLDAALAVRFKDALKTLVDEGVDYMILDLSQVGFMDSSGLGAVVAHLKYMGAERNFEICSLTPNVEKVFKLTRMDNVFKIHPSAEVAISDSQKMAG